jgi:hypothetical protein
MGFEFSEMTVSANSLSPMHNRCRIIPFDKLGFKGIPSSSKLTLSRESVERRWEVKRGDFGCRVSWPSCSPSPFVSGTAGMGRCSILSCVWVEDDLRLVNDRVLSTEAVRGGSADVVSFASSNVSYREYLLAQFLGVQMQVMGRVTLPPGKQGRGIATYILPV